MITCTISADKPQRKISPVVLDATLWFTNVGTDTYVLSLARHGWSDCSVADYIALYFSGRVSSVVDFFEFLGRENNKGFTCVIDHAQAKEYLASKRSRIVESLNKIELQQGRSVCPVLSTLCGLCGGRMPDNANGKTTFYKNRYYCPTCSETSFQKCVHCGAMYLIGDEQLVEDKGEKWCPNCIKGGAVECSHCNCWFSSDYYYIDNKGYYLCYECAEADNVKCCSHCGNYASEATSAYDNDTHWYCKHCRDRMLYHCDGCGEWYEAELAESHGRYLCGDCFEEEEPEEVEEE